MMEGKTRAAGEIKLNDNFGSSGCQTPKLELDK